jgi:DNA-directed RNA polymerase subunit RPC12/RpoP
MRGFEPISLANMRANGVRSVTASCANCGRSADVNVDALPETLTVPEAGKRLRCSSCGGKTIDATRMAYEPTSGRPGLSTVRTAADVLGPSP